MSALPHDTVRELIGSEISVPALTLDRELTDPDTGAVVSPQLASAPEQVDAAIANAAIAHAEGAWFGLTASERAGALRALKGELESRVADLAAADSLDTGVPLAMSTAMLGGTSFLLEVAASEVEQGYGHVTMESSAGTCDQWQLPWGPAAAFLPWNAPSGMAIMRTADALTAGCPVIIKPSEWAPHFSGAFAEAVRASLPPGVVQLVHGGRAVGQALVGDQRIAAVSYTGGVAGGTAVAEACARQLKPVDLELSGNNPVVVLPGADLAGVVGGVLGSMLMLNGQYCVGPRRLIVPEPDLATYLAAFGAAFDSILIGPSTDPTTQLGPLAHREHHEHVERQIESFAARGCEVRRYGSVPDRGHFTRPTIVHADAAPELQDEVFGPVLIVRTYSDLDEAVEIANDHPYGLSGYVFGEDRDAARAVGRRLRAGLVRLNSAFGATDVASVSSAWGASGIGRFGAGQGAKFLTGARFVG